MMNEEVFNEDQVMIGGVPAKIDRISYDKLCQEMMLYQAVNARKHKEVMDLLEKNVEQRPFSDSRFCQFLTPLHLAVLNLDVEMMDILLEAGAKVKGDPKCKLTPFEFFVKYRGSNNSFQNDKFIENGLPSNIRLQVLKRLIFIR